MGRKKVVRILSISIALLFLGVFLPSLTSGGVNPSSVTFEGVEVGSQVSETLRITNQVEGEVSVLFMINGANCGFSLAYNGEALPPGPYEGSLQHPEKLSGNNDYVDVEIIFAPTEVGTCSPTLMVSAGGFAQVTLEGTAVEAAKVTNIIIDEQDTGVLDFKYEGMFFSERLDEIAAEARNHGQYVRWVVFWTRRAYRDGMLDRDERKAIVKAAARANIPPRKSGLEDLVYNGVPVTDLIKACKENAENRKQYKQCVYELIKEMKEEGVIETKKEKRKIRRYAKRLKYRGCNKKK
jgi:hypothetical protein